MFFSFAFRLIVTLLIWNTLYHVIRNYRSLNTVLLSFQPSVPKMLAYTAIPVGFILFTVIFIFTDPEGFSLKTTMDAVVILSASFYLLYCAFIQNKITAEGLSVNLYGAYRWDEINKIELTDRFMTVHYQVKVPVLHSVKSFKVKLPEEKIEELSKIILENQINKQILYIKS